MRVYEIEDLLVGDELAIKSEIVFQNWDNLTKTPSSMRLRIVCDAKARTSLQDEIAFPFRGKTFGLIPGGDSTLKSVWIEAQLTSGTYEIPRFIDDKFFLDVNPQLQRELRSDLHDLEQLLTLQGVERLYIDRATLVLIPDTEEEANLIHVNNITLRYEKREGRMPLRPGDLNDLDKVGHLAVPLSMFRVGVAQLDQDNYALAFHLFFLILEGIYAAGETQKLERKFSDSTELVDVVIRWMNGPEAIEFRPNFESHGAEWTPDAVLRTFVRIRHHLNHFSLGSDRPYITPMNQVEYKWATFCLMMVVGLVLDLQINRARGLES